MNKLKAVSTALFLAFAILGSAQQWEIDFSDHEYSTFVTDGVLARDGSVMAIGYMASDSSYYNPLLILIDQYGGYKEHVYYNIPNLCPISLVKLSNGNYLSFGHVMENDNGVGCGALIFNDSLDILSVRLYEPDSIATKIGDAKAIVDDDGTVVVCGQYEPGSTRKRPFFYRLNEIGDIIDCLFVEPSSDYWVFECYQILRDPRSDGYIVIGTNRDGQCSMAFYDRQFNKTGSSMPSINGYASLYTRFNSEKWLSQDDMLTFGFARDGRGHGWDLLLADINLDGTVNRYNNILNTPDTSYNCRNRCMAVVNDTTIYGSFYIYRAFKDSDMNAGICLFNKNMELLGTRRFIEETYHDTSTGAIVALPDSGCMLLGFRYNKYHDSNIIIIKMSREDFNPILCSVSEVPKERLKAMAFPNPTKGELNIDISNLPKNLENRVSITDVSGMTRMCRIIQGSGNLLTIDVSSLEPGAYLYSVYNKEKELFNGKFVKE